MTIKFSNGTNSEGQTKLRRLHQTKNWILFQSQSAKANYLNALHQFIAELPDDTPHKAQLESECKAIESILTIAMDRVNKHAESAAGYLKNFHPEFFPKKKKRYPTPKKGN